MRDRAPLDPIDSLAPSPAPARVAGPRGRSSVALRAQEFARSRLRTAEGQGAEKRCAAGDDWSVPRCLHPAQGALVAYMIASSPTAGRGQHPKSPARGLRKTLSAPEDHGAPPSANPAASAPSTLRRPPTAPQQVCSGRPLDPASSAQAGHGRGGTGRPSAVPLQQRLRGRTHTPPTSQDASVKGRTERRWKVSSERYLLGLGGYDSSEYRQNHDSGSNGTLSTAAETAKSAEVNMPSGSSKNLSKASKAQATQNLLFGQPRERPSISANPAAEAASKSSTVNPAPRLRAGSVSTSITAPTKKSQHSAPQPVFRHESGRRWLRDHNLVYPLPVDLEEIHRQSMRLVLMMRVFAAPFCNKTFLSQGEDKAPETSKATRRRTGKAPVTPKGGLHGHPPTPKDRPAKVLEVACGAAMWSGHCHDYLVQHGHHDVQFVGMDIAPLAPDLRKTGVNWNFVQWDVSKLPWPFEDGEFDFIFIKDASLCAQAIGSTAIPIPETLRLLRRGGVVEMWDSDYVFRTLLSNPQLPPNTTEEEAKQAEACAVYAINASTPFVPPQNQYLTDCNAWITDALSKLELSPSPCGLVEWALRVESDRLKDIDSRRIAIPFEHTRWEQEANKALTPSQAALRRTALLTTLQFIQALEPILRESSGKRPDEWNRFWTAMMRDLLENKGARGGECLELGAWWGVRY